MPTRVRSFAKINLGLAIGPARDDGFHALTTLYHTIEAHDVVTVAAEALRPGQPNRIVLTSNDRRVPLDGRNTVWKMLERALAMEPFCSCGWAMRVHLDKRLPMQGGLGAGSANAAAALVGLERETGLSCSGAERLRIAAAVGSDVPLFLLGGAVLGLGRGEQVYPLPDLLADTPQAGAAQAAGPDPAPEPVAVVLALPGVGVSTPQAFRDWDARVNAIHPGASAVDGATPLQSLADQASRRPPSATAESKAENSRTLQPEPALTEAQFPDRLEELSRALAAAYCEPQTSSGVFFAHARKDLARHPLSALVRTGIRNDFEEVVFRQHPFLGTIKRALLGLDDDLLGESAQGDGALYAALSGSGSALFGLYRDAHSAGKAETRLRVMGVRTLRTGLLSRAAYWQQMFDCE